MGIEFRGYITRQAIRNEPGALFVFGDNLAKVGNGGQAFHMRGEPNSVGLPTKRAPSAKESAYCTDADLERVMTAASADITRLEEHLKAGKKVVWPLDGIGTGLAQLELRAPAIFTYYKRVLKNLQAL